MRVLVIGGTGLISGPVVTHLMARGAEVTIFHRGKTPCPDGCGIGEILGDRSDRADFVERVRAAAPWDCVIDMIGGVPSDAESLTAAARGAHVIFCSTTTVYGRPFLRVPVVEEGAKLAPPSAYGENKLACEQILRDAEARGDCVVTIIRPAHIYNERCLMLHSLGNRTSHLDRIREGRPVIVHDDGQGLWSSLWADDGGRAIAAAAFAPAARGRTYHLAGSEPFTWDAYQGLVASALSAPAPEIVHIPAETLAQLAPNRTLQCLRTLRYPGVYDCSAAVRDLGFEPCVSAVDGLARNARYLVENQLIEPWTADDEYEHVVSRFAQA